MLIHHVSLWARLGSYNLEPSIEPDDELVAGVATAMRDFLSWHGAKSLTIAKSDPAAFGEKLAWIIIEISSSPSPSGMLLTHTAMGDMGDEDEGTEALLGRRGPQSGLLPSLPEQRSTRDPCLVQRRGWHQPRAMPSDPVTVAGPGRR